ncbi:MAG: DUF423 domain-containing protein [Geminicoccaceae bacterium]|nr:DUF423 domain-containing protein [Geminicoccaceae bacterium]
MHDRLRRWLPVAAALLGGLAVAMGAFGAHVLAGSGETRAAELVETASRYQLAHAIAALVAGTLRPERLAGRLAFLVGAVLFPGSLYALALGLPRGLATLAPVGGTLFLVGWILFAIDLARDRATGPEPTGGGDPRP